MVGRNEAPRKAPPALRAKMRGARTARKPTAAVPAWTPTKLHRALREAYGPQGAWWPVDRGWHEKHGTDPRFEIILGSLLTQNTAWRNVEKALAQLKKRGALEPRVLLDAETSRVEEWVRSSGTYKEKARRVVETLQYFKDHGNLDLSRYGEAASMAPGHARRELLALHGVGPETADTILLYALGFPFFVVDAYTKRILARLGIMPERSNYEEVQRWFVGKMKPETAKFAEFHALLVEHAKARCRSEPVCAGCPLLAACPTGRANVATPKATSEARATPRASTRKPMEAPFLE